LETRYIIGKGHKQAIVSLADRTTRLALFAKVEKKTAERVFATIIWLLNSYADNSLVICSSD